MPRQNTPPTQYPSAVLEQIQQLAQRIVAARKRSGATQQQWAQQLGISQPTMARLERGDPAIASATYVMCLWLINPQLNLCQLLDAPQPPALAPALTAGAAQSSEAPAAALSPADEFAALLASFSPAVPLV